MSCKLNPDNKNYGANLRKIGEKKFADLVALKVKREGKTEETVRKELTDSGVTPLSLVQAFGTS